MNKQASVGSRYFLPEPSRWPLFLALGLFIMFIGAGRWLHDLPSGPYVFIAGITVIVTVLFGWFGDVIRENRAGCYNDHVDLSFRSGMMWMIFSEVMFFTIFFAALFFTRLWTLPELGGEQYPITHLLLWPDFQAEWPLLTNPDNHQFLGATSISSPWGIPLVNTLLLLSSAVTLTIAQWGLSRGHRSILIIGLLFTILLGATFLALQSHEYYSDFTGEGLTLNSGIYGSLFYILTGFHGLHVALGVIMLTVIFDRSVAGHFTPDNHFALEGVGWYWHFVDVVWLFLFVFVYWL